jgi:hypothetical protein
MPLVWKEIGHIVCNEDAPKAFGYYFSLRSVFAHRSSCKHIAFSPGGRFVFTSSCDSLQVYNTLSHTFLNLKEDRY